MNKPTIPKCNNVQIENHQLKNSPTQKLKSLSFILQYCSNFRSVLARIQAKKQVNFHYFYLLTPWCLSILKPRTCILHHFTFLVWLPTRIFFNSKNLLFAPKNPLFSGYFATFEPCFNGSRRFCLYHFSVFLCFSSCIQQHFALHLAPFYLVFSIKTHPILRQNALHLAPKRTSFCTILPCIQRQIALNLVQAVVLLNINSFCRIHKPTPFCIKTNLRENRFFAARWEVGG